MDNPPPRIWDLIEEALALPGATRIHLTVGRPPLVRIAEQGLQPLRENSPNLNYKTIQMMLCYVVEPERWDALERTGEGDIRLTSGAGRPITLTVFRASEAWSAVIHL